MISESVVVRNVIVYITISSRSFVFSQSRVEVSTSLFNVGGLDYEQPLFFRSPSSVKQKKKKRAKIGDEGSGSEARKNSCFASAPLVPNFRALFFFCFTLDGLRKNRGCSKSIGGLAVGAFDLINRSLGSSLSLTLVSKCLKCRNVVKGL